MSKNKSAAAGDAQQVEGADQAASTESDAPAVIATPSDLKAFSVLIPKCLLGEKCFVAADEQEAYMKYRKLGGVNGHDSQQIVKAVPKGSRDYAEAVAAYNAQLAKEAERKAAEDAAAALKPDAERRNAIGFRST